MSAVITIQIGFVARNVRATPRDFTTVIHTVTAVHNQDTIGIITSIAVPSPASAAVPIIMFFVSSGCFSVQASTSCATSNTFILSSSIIGIIDPATSLFTSSSALLSCICLPIAVCVASSANPLYVQDNTSYIAFAFSASVQFLIRFLVCSSSTNQDFVRLAKLPLSACASQLVIAR